MPRDLSKFLPVIVIVLVIAASIIGFLAGKGSSATKTPPTSSKSSQPGKPGAPEKPKTIDVSPLFDTQTATVRAKVTTVSGTSLTVQNQRGQTDTFQASSRLVIYKYPSGASQATSTSDLKDIELSEEALMVLEFADNKFQVVSITYLPKSPAPPPAATSPATKSGTSR